MRKERNKRVEDVLGALALNKIVGLEDDRLVNTNRAGKDDEIGDVVAGLERA